MSSKFQFELLRILRKRTGLAKAFTLIELLIVVAIIGLLAAIGIPRYLNIRANAEAGAKVGEAVGLGKECAVYVASGGLGTLPTYAADTPSSRNLCNSTSGSFVRTIPANTLNVKCIDDSSTAADGQVTVTVSSQGVVSCAFAAAAPATATP